MKVLKEHDLWSISSFVKNKKYNFDKKKILSHIPERFIDEAIKLNFEKYSREKWQQLSKNFNLSAIIVPVNWKIDLTPHAKSNSFAFYML